MKKIIIIISISLLLIGIVTGSLINYFGQINQTFEIKSAVADEWVFYIGNSKVLLINENVSSCGGSSSSVYNYKQINWTTENLGGINLSYTPQVNFYVRAKVNNSLQNLTLIFGYTNLSNDKIEICSKNVTLNNSNDYENMEFLGCNGNNMPINIKNFYYGMKGNCQDCKYEIRKCIISENFQTKIEVSKP